MKSDRLYLNKTRWELRRVYNNIVHYVTLPYVRLRNYILVKRFPFLEPQCGWSVDMMYHKPNYKYHYEETWLDGIPIAWRKKFGIQLCKELRQVIEEDNLKDYKVHQVKEKFGQLEWYDEGFNKRVREVVEKYRILSGRICINCGKPAKYVSANWISYYCPHCAKKIMKNKINIINLKKKEEL